MIEKIERVLKFNEDIISKHFTNIILCHTFTKFSFHVDLNKLTIFLQFAVFYKTSPDDIKIICRKCNKTKETFLYIKSKVKSKEIPLQARL